MNRIVIAIAMSMSVVSLAAVAAADTLIMKNGTRVQGTVVGIASSTLTFRHRDGVAHRYTMAQVDELRFGDDRASSPEAAATRLLTAPAGTRLVVRTVEAIDSRSAGPNQTFVALLEHAVTDASGRILIPERSSVRLVLTRVPELGATDSPEIVLDIRSITVAGKRYLVSTTDLERESGSGLGKNQRTAEMTGGGAVIGSIIGAIAGGGKGALIGVVVGGAGGAAAQVLTKGRDVKVPAETVLTFTLDQAITLLPEW